jgi:hypothetical protein
MCGPPCVPETRSPRSFGPKRMTYKQVPGSRHPPAIIWGIGFLILNRTLCWVSGSVHLPTGTGVGFVGVFLRGLLIPWWPVHVSRTSDVRHNCTENGRRIRAVLLQAQVMITKVGEGGHEFYDQCCLFDYLSCICTFSFQGHQTHVLLSLVYTPHLFTLASVVTYTLFLLDCSRISKHHAFLSRRLRSFRPHGLIRQRRPSQRGSLHRQDWWPVCVQRRCNEEGLRRIPPAKHWRQAVGQVP